MYSGVAVVRVTSNGVSLGRQQIVLSNDRPAPQSVKARDSSPTVTCHRVITDDCCPLRLWSFVATHDRVVVDLVTMRPVTISALFPLFR